ncbi:MAG: hypothetical protein ACYC2Y_05440 [Armatimonadota bacterium]
MNTEVQMSTNLSHLIYFKKMLTLAAASTGMNRKEVEDAYRAVVRVCSILKEIAGEHVFTVLLSLAPAQVTIEVSDPKASVREGINAQLASICRFVDKLEITEEIEGLSIRLVKSTRRLIGVQAPALGV